MLKDDSQRILDDIQMKQKQYNRLMEKMNALKIFIDLENENDFSPSDVDDLNTHNHNIEPIQCNESTLVDGEQDELVSSLSEKEVFVTSDEDEDNSSIDSSVINEPKGESKPEYMNNGDNNSTDDHTRNFLTKGLNKDQENQYKDFRKFVNQQFLTKEATGKR
jgi:hypothetical protein